MDDDSTRQSVLFSDLLGKRVVAKFDREFLPPRRSDRDDRSGDPSDLAVVAKRLAHFVRSLE